MRLFEAIVDANHRALAGDQKAGLHPSEFAGELPVVALTCIDVRLNPLLPEVLGVPKEQFIWLRNAGNIITGPLSSTMRSLALACAIKGGKEIAIIGHSDCQVSKTSTMELIERLRALGVERHLLPANVNEFFGTFSSERANVIKAADIVRQSPLIGPKIPVHGLVLDIETGRVEWIVNGYQTLELTAARPAPQPTAPSLLDAFKKVGDFEMGEMKFPEAKIGEAVSRAEDWLAGKLKDLEPKPAAPGSTAPPGKPLLRASYEAWRREKEKEKPEVPPKIAVPPPLRPRMRLYKGRK
jgi:carbonic anhydrase